jgi:hypothetical protein
MAAYTNDEFKTEPTKGTLELDAAPVTVTEQDK